MAAHVTAMVARTKEIVPRGAANIAAMFLVAFVATGCGCGDPFYDRYTRSKPSVQNLAGTWIVDPALSTASSPTTSSTPMTIVLSGDGTFRIANAPTSEFNVSNAAGTWQIQAHQDWWGVSIRYDVAGVDVERFLDLRDDRPPHALHLTVGDPDEGRAIVFVKQETRT